MTMKSSFILAFLLTLSLHGGNGNGGVTSVDAFSSSSSSSSVCRSKPSAPLHSPIHPSHCSSSSQLQFFSGFEMGGLDAVNENDKKDSTSPSSQTNNNNESSQDELLFFAALVTKAIIIMMIKGVKDIVNYPPNLLDQYNRYQQMRNEEIASEQGAQEESVATTTATGTAAVTSSTTTTTAAQPLATTTTNASSDLTPLPFELTKSNPFILLAKFLGVLTFKTLHDSLYYPALWIHNYLYPPRNDDDYYYYY